MARLAVVAGHTLLGTSFAANAKRAEVPAALGQVAVLDAGEFVYLQRHGFDEYVAPHAIDHGANMAALGELGCDRVLALGSAGSLRSEIPVGTFIAPDDFISFARATVFDDARGHRVPGFDREWRWVLIGAFAAAGLPLRDGGVYWQSEGPRFETPAEVRMIARDADLVGMTIASEAVIAAELGLRYAAVCSIDNLANGIEAEPLALEDYEAGKAANQDRAQRALAQVIPGLAGGGGAVSLAVEGATLGGERVGLRVEDGLIAELGPEVRAAPGDERIDGSGTALVPGLVNGHTHAAMTLFRGYGDDLPLMEWLEGWIWPAEARLTAEDVYWGTRLACAEMIRTGTVRFFDMYWHAGETARAVADAGIRAVIGAPLIDTGEGTGIGGLRDVASASLDEIAAVDAGDRISGALAPHAIYTVSEESLRWVADEAAERELAVHIHLSETEKEVGDCVEARGVRPAHYLDRLGPARAGDRARPRRLARRLRARADRRAGGDPGDEPRRQHEARGRRSVPLREGT